MSDQGDELEVEEIEEEEGGMEGLHPDVPVERQRMLLRPWLELHLELGDVPGLEWVDKNRTMFRILWKHRSKGNWTAMHGAVFMEWAKNTGRLGPDGEMGGPLNYAHMKTRLRCAINKAPDIEEVESLTNMRALEPYKVYRFLPKLPPKVSFHQPRRKRMQMSAKRPDEETLVFSPKRLHLEEGVGEVYAAEDGGILPAAEAPIPETVVELQEEADSAPTTTQVLWLDTDSNTVQHFETNSDGINALVEAARMSSIEQPSRSQPDPAPSNGTVVRQSVHSKDKAILLSSDQVPPVGRAEVIDLSVKVNDPPAKKPTCNAVNLSTKRPPEETSEASPAPSAEDEEEKGEDEDTMLISAQVLVREHQNLENYRFALEVKEKALASWETRLKQQEMRLKQLEARLRQQQQQQQQETVLPRLISPRAPAPDMASKKPLDGLAILSDVAMNKAKDVSRMPPPERAPIVIRPVDIKKEVGPRGRVKVIVERVVE